MDGDGKSAIDKCGQQIIAVAHAIKIISFRNYLITDHKDRTISLVKSVNSK